MDVYDTTNYDSQNNIVASYHLNKNGAFYEDYSIDSNSPADYSYILTARFLSWFQIVNGKSYKIRLSWVNPNNSLETQSVTYTWTMSLTSEQQAIQDQKTDADINSGIHDLNNNINNLNTDINNLNNGINDINNFLTDDDYNSSSIVSNMPNSDSYNNPAENGINTIFSAFQNAFTNNDSAQSVRFVIPNSNGQYIDIPADLVSSKLPQPIIFLIQAFYWFLICRFIIKDISNTAEKAKSGELLDSSDGNIKTDLM